MFLLRLHLIGLIIVSLTSRPDKISNSPGSAVLIGLITPEMMEISPPYVYTLLSRIVGLGSCAIRCSITFVTFALACFIGYFWSTYVVPETANVSLEEIDAVFGSSAGQEDAELKREVRHSVI